MLAPVDRSWASVFQRRQKDTTQKKVTTPKQPPFNVATAPEDMTTSGGEGGVEVQVGSRGPLPAPQRYM